MSLNTPTNPTPFEKLSGKEKKTTVLVFALCGALSLFSLPILVSAHFLSSLLLHTASETSASDSSFNSQTMPLLAAAKNIDPNPSVGGGDIVLVHGEALLSNENPDVSVDSEKPTNTQISVYTVRDGDSLSSIASMFKVTNNTIIGANNIKKGVIHPGEQLIILPIAGVQHVVGKNETLATLAKQFNSEANDIAAYNNIGDDENLMTGQTIIIPNGELPVIQATPSKPIAQTKTKTVATKTKTTKSKAFKGAPLRDAGGPEYDGYYSWPVAGGIITQSLHGYNGVDIGAPTGTDIYASAGGTVIIAKDNNGWNGGYGNYIVVAHDNGTQTLYAHASKVLVSVGDSVSAGQLIAKVGRTGEATGPHLHFEVRGATNPFGAIPVGSGD